MNLGRYLDDRVARYREHPYLYYYEQTITYAVFGDRVNQLANGLRELGVGKGDIVHVMLPNSPENLVAYFAIQKLGAVAGPINGQWRARELQYVLNDSGAKALIIASKHLAELEPIRGACPHLKIVIEGGDPLRRLIEGSPAAPVSCDARDDEPAYIFYTSGTTGSPKGVLLSHHNVFADLRSFQEAMKLDEGYRILVFLPLFHVNAMLTCVSTIDKGGATVLRTQFSAGEFWPTVEKYKVNFFSAVPAIYAILLADTQPQEHDRSSLWFGICGAAPMPIETFREFERRFGVPIVEGYGLTEGTCVSTINPRAGTRKVGSIGLPCPGQKVMIVDEKGNEVPPGQRGEIVVRGEVVMLGYHNRPAETAEALRGGVLHTGDVGYRDEDGYIFIVDRLKDMVIRGGENIYPKEIDNVLASHPAVREAASVGVPDAVLGEELKAYVILREGARASQDEIREFCKAQLAAYKVPRYIQILDRDFPRNAVGKILKKEIKAWGIEGPKV